MPTEIADILKQMMSALPKERRYQHVLAEMLSTDDKTIHQPYITRWLRGVRPDIENRIRILEVARDMGIQDAPPLLSQLSAVQKHPTMTIIEGGGSPQMDEDEVDQFIEAHGHIFSECVVIIYEMMEMGLLDPIDGWKPKSGKPLPEAFSNRVKRIFTIARADGGKIPGINAVRGILRAIPGGKSASP